MKLPPFTYHAVDSVDRALHLLAEHGDEAKVLAGGQSLVPLLALRLARPEHLIDINRVDSLGSVVADDGLRIGALVRHRAVERTEAIAVANPLLATAVRFIGHSAIRNRGTIGGSIAHADPAAELPAVLLALDGEVELTSSRGTREVGAARFFEGFLSVALEPDELVSAVHLPAWPPGTGWSFQEFSRRHGDFGLVGVAVALRLGAGGGVADARIAYSGMAATPVRATKAESLLSGQSPAEQAWAAAAECAVAGLEPPSDLHATSAYRLHLAAALTRRALREASERAEVGR